MYASFSLTKDNCPISTTRDTATFFPVDQVTPLIVILVVLAVDYEGILPQDSWQAILDALVTTEPLSSITGKKHHRKVSTQR